LLQSLLTRASRLAETMPLDEVTYDDVKVSGELKVFYKFLQWQRKDPTIHLKPSQRSRKN